MFLYPLSVKSLFLDKLLVQPVSRLYFFVGGGNDLRAQSLCTITTTVHMLPSYNVNPVIEKSTVILAGSAGINFGTTSLLGNFT